MTADRPLWCQIANCPNYRSGVCDLKTQLDISWPTPSLRRLEIDRLVETARTDPTRIFQACASAHLPR